MTAKLFPVTTVGRWPRPPVLVRALRQRQEGTIDSKGFGEVADAAVLESVRCQETPAWISLPTASNAWVTSIRSSLTSLTGVKLTSVSDQLEYVPDRARFGDLCAPDVPAFAIKSTVATGRIRESLRIRAR